MPSIPSLISQKVKQTFRSLLHLENNTGASASASPLYDGAGNLLPVTFSTSLVDISALSINTNPLLIDFQAGTPSNPPSSHLYVYAKSDKHLYILDSTGTESDLTGGGSSIASTDDLPEGVTNLYYTTARFDTRFSSKTTTDLTEGSNLYYTAARFNTAFSAKSTSDLSEGSNLYYTDERVDDRVAVLIQNGTGITWSYNDGANTLTPTVTITQYTDEMAQDAVGNALVDSGRIDFIYNDAANTIIADIVAGSISSTYVDSSIALSATTITVAGTANEITSSAGAQSLAANRTWTLSLPSALTFTGKTVTGGTYSAPTINVNDNALSIRDDGDTTKIAQFQCSGITTGTTRTLTIPDASGTIALTSDLSSYQPLDSTLTSLAAYNTNGLIAQTAADTFAGRTITGTSNEVSISNGNGVSGNPTISLAPTVDLSSHALYLPNGTGPTTSTTGSIALDTDGDATTIKSGVIQYYDGTRNLYCVAVDGYPSANNDVPVYNSATNRCNWAAQSGSGGGAPTGATYVTLSTDATLSAERVLTAGSNISITDAGAGSTVTVAVTGIGSSIQGYDATLAALAAYNTNGLLTQTAADTFTGRTITGTANEITATNGDGVSGNPTLSLSSTLALRAKTVQLQDNNLTISDDLDSTKLLAFQCSGITTGTTRTLTIPDADGTIALTANTQPLDATLTALAAYNTNGVLCQTAADTFAGRTITGTSNEISVSNGDGVSGNPTLSLPTTIDLSGKTSLKIPTGTGPTVNASGIIAIDSNSDNTNITHGSVTFHDGTSQRYIPSIDTYPTTDGHALKYDGTNKKYVFGAISASLDINGLTEDTDPDLTADYVPTYDASAAGNKKVLLNTLRAEILAASYPIMIGQFSA